MILLETLARRWFAFAFIVAFFAVAIPERGWKRALRFLAIAAFVSFVAEYASTHSGIPYGRYQYTGLTRGDEIYVSNVPLFVPLSFGVVVWAGRAVTLAALPLRAAWHVVIPGALAAAVIDLAIDPMTLRGGQWFLGHLYFFRHSSVWFGVPWSNFGGWVLVAAIVIWLDELFEVDRERVMSARGPALALGMCAFFVLLALVTKNFAITFWSALITAGLAALVARGPLMRSARLEPDPPAAA